ncbi:MAG TPA: mechanosensitive ion channel family protein [Dissulfurispiraceae bacterium]|nr:mechanosensitive ion channel family protein [Dissulfurispiraceae bacterium]
MTIHDFIITILIVVAAAAATVITRGIAFRLLRSWDRRAATLIGGIIIGSIRVPTLYLCIAAGLYAGIAASGLPEKYTLYFNKALHVIVIFSVTVAIANLAGKIFRNYIQKSDLPIPTTGLAYGLLKGTIYVIGIVIILAVLGISIAPLITALGVGGLAVALALQDTLANLFAGIHILVEKSIRVGDFIKLESGQEGMVEDITWRTTRIKMLPQTVVVIPNKKLSQSVVTNFALPEKEMMLVLHVGVGYDSDPEKIEAVLIDEAEKAKSEVDGLLRDLTPVVRLAGFGESSLDFVLMCRIREYAVQQPVMHELRKRILKRFREEGIEIPFPHRTVIIGKDGAGSGIAP